MGWNSSHFSIVTLLVTASVQEVGKSFFFFHCKNVSFITKELAWPWRGKHTDCLFVESLTTSAGSLYPSMLQGIMPSWYLLSEFQFHFKKCLTCPRGALCGQVVSGAAGYSPWAHGGNLHSTTLHWAILDPGPATYLLWWLGKVSICQWLCL